MDIQDGTERTLKLQRSLEKFIESVDELRNEDDPSGDGFTREFAVIRDHGIRMKEQNTYPAEEGKKSYNIKKNRYRDILPFDETRVRLNEIPGKEGSDYINANIIRSHMGHESYIASQGPLAHTLEDFWRMIIQYSVKVIAMACQVVEMGKKKCEQYWPEYVNDTKQYGDVSVTLVSVEELAENCMKRVMVAVQGDKQQTVTHFHYTYWPDHDIPNDFDAILEMMAEMRQIKAEDSDRSPMLVHCSAGCGRTGTICAIDYSWELLQSGNLTEDFSLHDIVMQMRQQRQSMIQTPGQYMMAHVIIQQLFRKHLEMMEDHSYGNVQFSAEESTGNLETVSISSQKSSSRTNSLSRQIETTLKKVSGDNTSVTEATVPLTKEQSSYIKKKTVVEEHPDPLKSPGVKKIASKFMIDQIDNTPVTKGENIPAPKQTLGSQTSVTSDGKKKHVTTIAIRGGATKQPVAQTKSHPVNSTTNPPATVVNRANTYPSNSTIKDNPQASIPPTLPSLSQDGVYSYAENDKPPQMTDSSYSAVSTYSSGKPNTENIPVHMYHVLQKPEMDSIQENEKDGSQPGDVYSLAKEPTDNIYSAVQKPRMNGASNQNKRDSESHYESVVMGEKAPPPIPNRGYLEVESENHIREKPALGAGDLHTMGKTKQFMNNLRNVFTTGKPQSASDTNLPRDVPGYKEKIGRKPKGPRDPPWKKK